MTTQTVVHNIPPLYDSESRVLLLGSIPSPKSREVVFFYGHPQNRFWRVLAAVLDEPMPASIPEKRAMCLKHHIALWDTIAQCDIAGASDTSIKNAVPNDIGRLLRESKIERIYATGGNATAAHLSGIKTKRVKLIAFMLSGLLASVAGMIHSAQISQGGPNEGMSYEMYAVAAVAIGGTSMAGGKGSIVGTVLGMLIIGVMNNLLTLFGVPPFLREAFKGIIVIVAVLLQKKEADA